MPKASHFPLEPVLGQKRIARQIHWTSHLPKKKYAIIVVVKLMLKSLWAKYQLLA